MSRNPTRPELLAMANDVIASICKTVTPDDRGGKSTLYEVVGDRYIGLMKPYELASSSPARSGRTMTSRVTLAPSQETALARFYGSWLACLA